MQHFKEKLTPTTISAQYRCDTINKPTTKQSIWVALKYWFSKDCNRGAWWRHPSPFFYLLSFCSSIEKAFSTSVDKFALFFAFVSNLIKTIIGCCKCFNVDLRQSGVIRRFYVSWWATVPRHFSWVSKSLFFIYFLIYVIFHWYFEMIIIYSLLLRKFCEIRGIVFLFRRLSCHPCHLWFSSWYGWYKFIYFIIYILYTILQTTQTKLLTKDEITIKSSLFPMFPCLVQVLAMDTPT